MSKVIHLNEGNFNKEVIEASGVVLVDFWATWCGPCKMISPILDELSEELGDVKITKVDVDENQQVAATYGIRSIPTMFFFKDGKKVHQEIGFKPKEELLKVIEEVKNM